VKNFFIITIFIFLSGCGAFLVRGHGEANESCYYMCIDDRLGSNDQCRNACTNQSLALRNK